MARKPSLRKQLEALAAKFIPDIRKAFIAAIRDVTETSMIQVITDAIREGDIEKAFRATGMSAAAMRPVSAMIEAGFEAGGVTMTKTFPKLNSAAGPTIFRFDVRNSRAEAWLRDQSAGLVTRIADQTRENIQIMAQAGLRDGRNPRNVALDIIGRVDPQTGRRIGGVVGLTDQQTKWVANARTELTGVPKSAYFERVQRDLRFDRIVQRAINTGKPIAPGKVDAIIGKYSDNLLQLRGETIARTEMLGALAKSQYEAIKQAVDTGTVDPKAITKKWDATGDGRTRFSHAVMEGQAVRFDEAFTTPTGAKLLYPLDNSLGAPASEIINCRCRVDYDIDFLAGLEGEFTPEPPPKPVETQAARNARLIAEQNNQVLDLGRSTGVEHLRAVDQATGQILGSNAGTKGNVKFTPEFEAAIRDPLRSIVATHNHPSSSSFSNQDLFILAQSPGMQGLYALAHNGSKFYAERGTATLNDKLIKQTDQSIISQIQYDIRRADNPKQFVDDMNLIGGHITMLVLNGKKRIQYTSELLGSSAEAFERNRSYIENLLKGYLK